MSAPLRRAAALSVRAACSITPGIASWTPVRTIAPEVTRGCSFSGTSRPFCDSAVNRSIDVAQSSDQIPQPLGASRGFASDSDDDFKPQVYASGSDEIRSVIAKDVADNRVLLYMKGTPSAPQCGFSNMAVQILNFHGVEYATRNVLASEDVRNGIKEFSSWPTIPQVFIDGEFVGGCDILRQMHSDGELEKALKK